MGWPEARRIAWPRAGPPPPAPAAAPVLAPASGRRRGCRCQRRSRIGDAPARSRPARGGCPRGPADLVRPRPTRTAQPGPRPRTGRRPAVSSTRPPRTRSRVPPWERIRRYEAYPTIKTRAGLPGCHGSRVLAGALGDRGAGPVLPAARFSASVAAGSGREPDAGPLAASAGRDASRPTAPPVPTSTDLHDQGRDTLSKVAKKFGVTLEDLLAANKDTIKDPNKIAIGPGDRHPAVGRALRRPFSGPSAVAPVLGLARLGPACRAPR